MDAGYKIRLAIRLEGGEGIWFNYLAGFFVSPDLPTNP